MLLRVGDEGALKISGSNWSGRELTGLFVIKRKR